MLNRIISSKGRGSLFSLLMLFAVFFIVGFSSGEVSIKNIALNESPEIGFTSLSPNGLLGGEIIPASCESGDYHDSPSFGTACTASSVCGQAYGTIGCGGVCSVAAPFVPSNYGKVCLVSNVCGQSNQGTIGCDGSCTVKEAPALPAQYGTPCQSTQNSCGQKATGIIGCVGLCTAITPSDLNCTTCGNNVCNSSEDNSNCPSDCPYVAPATPSTPAGEGAIWTPATEWTLTASPNPIFANTRTTVSWSVSGATGCTLVGVGAVSGKETDRFVGGPALDYQSSKLQENTDFTLTCSNAYSGRKDSKSVTVKVRTIKVQEF